MSGRGGFFGGMMDPSVKNMEIPQETPDYMRKPDPNAGVLATIGEPQTLALNNDRDPVLAIDGFRRDLGAQRKTLDDFYAKMSKMEPLIARCLAMSNDVETLKRECSTAELKQIFVPQARFTEVVADIKLEMKTTQVVANTSSSTGMKGADVQAMALSINQAVHNAFQQGSAQQNNILMPTIDSMKNNMDAMRQEFNNRVNDLRSEMYAKVESSSVHANQLSPDIDARIMDLRNELKTDVSALHDLLEHTALKAGHLAIAASECTQDQKALLFQTLKNKEQFIQSKKTAAAVPFPTFPQSMGNPQIVFNEIMTQNPPEFDITPRGGYPGTVTPPPVTEEFTINVIHQQGEKLGLSLNGQDGQTLLIERIGDGIVKAWNETQSPQVFPGDRIVAVNGMRGESKQLIGIANELLNSGTGTLALTISSARLKEFIIRLFLMKDEKLGLSLDCDEQGVLVVTAVQPGLVSGWNTQHPEKVVMAGDRVVAANGVGGNPSDIIAQTTKGGELQLTIVRQ